jgi:PAS domain S-box-containing protein
MHDDAPVAATAAPAAITAPDFRALFEAAPDLYLVLTPALTIAAVSDAYARATMTTRAGILGRGIFEVFPDNPDDANADGVSNLRASLLRVLELRRADAMAVQKYDIQRSDAEGGGFEERHWAPVNTPVLDAAGAVAWIIHRVEDVTEQARQRKAAELRASRQAGIIDELRATESFLEALVENLPGMLVVKSLPEFRYVLMNRAAEEIMGVDRADIIGKTVHDFFPKAEADAFDARDRAVIESGEPLDVTLDRVPTRTKGLRQMQTIKVPVTGTDGKAQFLLGVYHDVTDSMAMEQQLRQAMKMEAVGQLTGGIAHDFNNLLGIIVGNLDVAVERIGTDKLLRECLDDALKGALRGADLTRRLLSFSRKQPLKPEVIDLNHGLPEMASMLRRTLGERLTVELHPGADLWPAVADAAQIDQAVLNLAINARDAMMGPEGQGSGILSIETANARLDADYAAHNAEVTPGDYVQLSVSDNGSGMSPETLERCFEPFFTTKSVEKGSGLGLSMVYGFVKQSRGHIKVYSELGHGTTVKIYLPRAHSGADVAAVDDAADAMVVPGRELLLAVEDNADLRKVTVRQLTELGYRVLEAGHAQAALDLLAANPAIDLLFTDIVMPGRLTGSDLAREAQRLYPKLKILLTSGYSARTSAGGFQDIPGVELLQKPFRKQDLAKTLRRVLDAD